MPTWSSNPNGSPARQSSAGPARTGTAASTAPAATASAATAPGSRASGSVAVHSSARTSAATRYLCIATHLDARIARTVIEDVLEEPRLAVTLSPAVDLVTVCLHALAAHRRHVVRDAALVGALVVAMSGLSGFPQRLPLIGLAAVIAWAAVFAETYIACWGNIAQGLHKDNFATSSPPVARTDRMRRQIAHVAGYATGNVTVYRGYNPFAGHGWLRAGWSVALDTTQPEDPAAPILPFTAVELNTRLTADLARLDIPDLTVGNRLLVNGADVHNDRRFLPDPYGAPTPWADPVVLAQLMTHPEDRARPYLTVEIVCWEGEMVWSAFLRLVLNEDSLFVEANYTVVPPFSPDYYVIDDLLAQPTAADLVRLALRSARRLPKAMVGCLPGVSHHLLAGLRRWRKDRLQLRQIRELSRFHHGALVSLRESAAHRDSQGAIGYHRYFQSLDEQMVMKIVDKRVFNTLLAFLSEKNVDPAELKRRSEQIISNSVTVGGDLNMSHSALGGASASVSAPTSGSATGH
ncbi:hypothetical protein [Nocardia niigatensis]|uniref:hypothetical protein n=1 Tax=Nocardia niigatensis TaxID=209249 RepID=UPI0005952703|nr:hypothetical protein [Nocardia niigatensis]